MEIEVTFKISDIDMWNAMRMIWQGEAVTVQEIAKDLFSKKAVIEFDKIVDKNERMFWLNGTVANLVTLVTTMEQIDSKPKIII